jgi:hypothetical protein
MTMVAEQQLIAKYNNRIITAQNNKSVTVLGDYCICYEAQESDGAEYGRSSLNLM